MVIAQIENLHPLIQSGQYTSAERLLLTLKNRTEAAEQLTDINHRLGELHYQYTHQYDRALIAFEDIIRLSTLGDDRYLAQIKRGDVFCRLGQHPKAIQAFQELAENVPSDHFAYQTGQLRIRTIQDALIRQKQYQSLIDQSAESRIDKAEAKFRIAELYRQPLNQPQQAVNYYQQIVTEYPQTPFAPESLWRLGHIYNRILHRPSAAVRAYQQVERQYTTCAFAADAIYQMARIHCQQKQFKLAHTNFEKIIHHYPSFWKIYAVFYWLGVACEGSSEIAHQKTQTADYRSAIKAYKTFLNLYLPNLDPAHFGEIAKYKLDRVELVAQIQRKISQLESDLPANEWAQFKRSVSQKNYPLALEIGRDLVTNFPDSFYAQKAKADLSEVRHQAAIQRLLEVTPCPSALLQIGAIYDRDLQDVERALEVYTQLVATFPDSNWVAEALHRIGSIYLFEYKNISQAIQIYDSLTRQHCHSPQAMQASFQLGEIYRHLQQFDMALSAYRLTVTHLEQEQYLGGGFKDSFADQAQFRIASIFYQQGNFQAALVSFQDFLLNRSESPRLAAAYAYIGLIYQQSGQKQKAFTAFQKSIDAIQTHGRIQAIMVVQELESSGTISGESTTVIHASSDRTSTRKAYPSEEAFASQQYSPFNKSKSEVQMLNIRVGQSAQDGEYSDDVVQWIVELQNR